MDEFLLSGFDSAGEDEPADKTPKQNGLKKKDKKKNAKPNVANT